MHARTGKSQARGGSVFDSWPTGDGEKLGLTLSPGKNLRIHDSFSVAPHTDVDRAVVGIAAKLLAAILYWELAASHLKSLSEGSQKAFQLGIWPCR